MVYRLISHFLSRRLALCLLCQAPAGNAAGICTSCAAELPQLGCTCPRCARPLPVTATCPQCLRHPPAFDAAHCAWHYAYPVAQLVRRLKDHGDMAAAHSLTLLAAERLRPDVPPDILVPVPLHWRRYWQRGFNQAQVIAARLGHHWQLPVDTGALRRLRSGPSQQQLNRSQRLRNLEGCFAAHRRVEGLRIGLVDDVMTTGATLEAAARSLRQAGALSICTFAMARTP
ncbi:ComF family protein [Microbulbifer sediminum]|uniref:ComF family protein n=1 Tax=Microbulbifer sediminum TaxID=2904250 RepID=UPI001F358DAC|nr:ComF family protein [Microbulbifer sediminum]